MDISFAPMFSRIIYVSKILELRNNFMKFKGYYHEEDKNFPIEKLMYYGKQVYWIRIHTKKQYDMDVSGGFYDEDVGANICLFPSYIVELHFTILKKGMNKAETDQIFLDIMEDEKLIRERARERDAE